MKLFKLPAISLYVTVLLSVSCLLLSPGCTNKQEQEKTFTRNPVLVKVEAVKKGPLVRTLVYKATVFPWKQANIAPDTSGRIHKIYKKQGDRVEKGQLLAELDATTFKLQLRQAQAALDVAEAAHKDAALTVQRLEKLYRKMPGICNLG